MAFDIHQKRTELNLTLEEIANFVGVSKSTVKKWESGYIKNMRRDKIIKLATILKVSPMEILHSVSDLTPSSDAALTINDNFVKPLTELLVETFKVSLDGSYAIVFEGRKLTLVPSKSTMLSKIIELINHQNAGQTKSFVIK